MQTRIETEWAVTWRPVGADRWRVLPVALPLETAESAVAGLRREKAGLYRCEAMPVDWLVSWSRSEGRS